MEDVEVRVHSVRRRRKEPRLPEAPRVHIVRSWLIYAGLAALVSVLMFDGYLSHKPLHAALPQLSEVTEVRSDISAAADSLQIVVSWDLTLASPEGQPDSILIKVVPTLGAGNDSLAAIRPATVFADTAYLSAPAAGQTFTGLSCVAARHVDLPLHEICTPWQYVRPAAVARASVPSPRRIVIQPNGLQVDPDVGGKCAAWQRTHPGESVWIAINRMAVKDCTGVNGKPTVAQFCAFMVLSDGRKAKAANSANSVYCDELFEEWSRERYS
ncbi:MAG: hypothetical protein ACJ8BF_13910 [Gemmatimonadales bacterium]